MVCLTNYNLVKYTCVHFLNCSALKTIQPRKPGSLYLRGLVVRGGIKTLACEVENHLVDLYQSCYILSSSDILSMTMGLLIFITWFLISLMTKDFTELTKNNGAQ